ELLHKRSLRDLMRMARACRRDEDMLLFHEFGERRGTAQTWMILLKNAHVPARKKLLPAYPRNQQRKFSDRQIDLTRFERDVKVLQFDLRRSQPNSRCRVQEQLHDDREQHDHAGVEGEVAESHRRLAG